MKVLWFGKEENALIFCIWGGGGYKSWWPIEWTAIGHWYRFQTCDENGLKNEREDSFCVYQKSMFVK